MVPTGWGVVTNNQHQQKAKFNFQNCPSMIWQNTSYELQVASYELLVTSWNLKNTIRNWKVRVQIHEFNFMR